MRQIVTDPCGCRIAWDPWTFAWSYVGRCDAHTTPVWICPTISGPSGAASPDGPRPTP